MQTACQTDGGRSRRASSLGLCSCLEQMAYGTDVVGGSQARPYATKFLALRGAGRQVGDGVPASVHRGASQFRGRYLEMALTPPPPPVAAPPPLSRILGRGEGDGGEGVRVQQEEARLR